MHDHGFLRSAAFDATDVRAIPPGQQVTLGLRRDGSDQEVMVTPSDRPADRPGDCLRSPPCTGAHLQRKHPTTHREEVEL
jgi:hypothetical protein